MIFPKLRSDYGDQRFESTMVSLLFANNRSTRYVASRRRLSLKTQVDYQFSCVDRVRRRLPRTP